MSLRLSSLTTLPPEQVVERAARYFGDQLGLTTVWRAPVSVRFEGGGGHVQVGATATPNGSEVELESMEWDHQVKEFAGRLPR